MNNYREILNIQLLHEYYKDGQCKLLQLKPDSITMKWINMKGLIFTQTKNIGRLFVPKSFSLQEAISDTPDFKLQFSAISNSSLFNNFTEFPINKLGVWFFENDNEQAELSPSFKEGDDYGMAVALASLSLSKLKNNNDDWPINYVINFKSRLTPWKYFIINNSQAEGIKFGLSGKGQELFQESTPTQLPNGQTAEVFESGSNFIPLKEDSPIDLALLKITPDNPSTGNEVFIEHLPNAGPDNIQYSLVDGKKEIYSAIYIYI